MNNRGKNRIRKTRNLFKKIAEIKGTFNAIMGTIKDKRVRTQQKQKRLRRGGKNTQKNNIGKVLMTWITMMV